MDSSTVALIKLNEFLMDTIQVMVGTYCLVIIWIIVGEYLASRNNKKMEARMRSSLNLWTVVKRLLG